MADRALIKLMRDCGIGADLSDSALSSIKDNDVIKFLANVLDEGQFLSPAQAELDHAMQQDNERQEDGIMNILLAQEAVDPEDEDLANDPDVMREIEKTRKLLADKARKESSLKELQDNRRPLDIAKRAGQRKRMASKGCSEFRAGRSERAAAKATVQDKTINDLLQATTGSAGSMCALVTQRPRDVLVTAHDPKDLSKIEDANMGKLMSAQDKLSGGELADQQRKEQEAAGALADNPFGPSSAGGSVLLGVSVAEVDQRTKVYEEGQRLNAGVTALRDKVGRMRATAASLERQKEVLEQILHNPAGMPQWDNAEAQNRMQLEADQLLAEIRRLQDCPERQEKLRALSDMEHGASCVHSLTLLQQQRLSLQVGALQRLVDAALQQRARIMAMDLIREEELERLKRLFVQLNETTQALNNAVAASRATREDLHRAASDAQAAADAAASTGLSTRLGADAHLTAAYSVLAAQEAAAPPGGLHGSPRSASASMSSSSSSAAGMFGGFGGSAAGGMPPPAPNAYLQAVEADPSQQSLTALMASACALASSVEGVVQGVHDFACKEGPQLAGAARQAVEDVSALLAGPGATPVHVPGSAAAAAAHPPAEGGGAADARAWPVLRHPGVSAALQESMQQFQGAYVENTTRLSMCYNHNRDTQRQKPTSQRDLEREVPLLFFERPEELHERMKQLEQSARDAEAAAEGSFGA